MKYFYKILGITIVIFHLFSCTNDIQRLEEVIKKAKTPNKKVLIEKKYIKGGHISVFEEIYDETKLIRVQQTKDGITSEKTYPVDGNHYSLSYVWMAQFLKV